VSVFTWFCELPVTYENEYAPTLADTNNYSERNENTSIPGTKIEYLFDETVEAQ
jgi:hypothetical protein